MFNPPQSRAKANKFVMALNIVLQASAPFVAFYLLATQPSSKDYFLDMFYYPSQLMGAGLMFAAVLYPIFIVVLNYYFFPSKTSDVLQVLLLPLVFAVIATFKNGIFGFRAYVADAGLNIYLALAASLFFLLFFGPLVEVFKKRKKAAENNQPLSDFKEDIAVGYGKNSCAIFFALIVLFPVFFTVKPLLAYAFGGAIDSSQNFSGQTIAVFMFLFSIAGTIRTYYKYLFNISIFS